MKFSVFMCVNKYNPWLDGAVDSILRQHDGDFEFLIGANACNEDLWSFLLEKSLLDKRIRLFRTKVGQLSFNLNYLADQAQGEYLVRMDADDFSEPHRLATLRLVLEDNEIDVLGSSVFLINENGDKVGRMNFPVSQEKIRSALRFRTVFCHPSVTLRRQFLFDMRGYLGGFVSEDTDLWLRAIRVGATLRNLPEPLLHYRIHANQSISSRQGYAEVASHWLRELLFKPDFYTLMGFSVASVKSIFYPLMPGVRHYRRNIIEMNK